MDRIDNYLQTLYLAEEFALLDESIGDAIKKFTADKAKGFMTKFKSMINSGNVKGAQSLVKSTGIGNVPNTKVDQFMNSKSADYGMAKTLATKVLTNSLPGKPKRKSIDIASTYIAIRSTMADKKGVPLNVTANAKKHIKEFIARANRYYDDYEQKADEAEKEGKPLPIPADSIPDYIVGAAIVIGFTSIAGITTWWLYTHLANIIMLLITVAAVLATFYVIAPYIPKGEGGGGTT